MRYVAVILSERSESKDLRLRVLAVIPTGAKRSGGTPAFAFAVVCSSSLLVFLVCHSRRESAFVLARAFARKAPKARPIPAQGRNPWDSAGNMGRGQDQPFFN
jgi:hypothetical protein